VTRRTVLAALPAAALVAAEPKYVKGICSIIFPNDVPLTVKFRRAKAAGFSAMELRIGDEIPLSTSAAELRGIARAASDEGVRIATLWASQPLHSNPLNSADAEARARGVADLRKVLPMAAAARVYMNMENVWNRFLVSPLEMRRFVDQFESPWLQAHFDIGNIMQYGIPQDWIRTLGPRIRRVHVKDYKLAAGSAQGRFVDLWEGDVDWKAVMTAFRAVGYTGYMSPEISYRADQPEQLETVSRQLDRILAL